MADHEESEGEKVYKCGHCGIISGSIDDLKCHMLDVHLNEANSLSAGDNAGADNEVQEGLHVTLPGSK